MEQETIIIHTNGRGTYNITHNIQQYVLSNTIELGLCHIFVHHTSASLILCENADPDVRQDLETFMARIAPDGDPDWIHIDEGTDDMPAHIRTVLTQNSLTIPITQGQCALGLGREFIYGNTVHKVTNVGSQ